MVNGIKGIKNLIFGIFAQIITIGLGIFIPRLVLVNLGSESNGLLNSISSILSYMSLLEAGVGMATLQALYKPFAENDKKCINRIMSATHFFYKRTGCIYLSIVAILSVGYTLALDSTIPKIEVFFVVILSGLSGVLSYFFQGKYKLFLSAEGKNYVVTNISTIVTVGISLTKAIVLVIGGDVVLVQSVYFIYNLFQAMALAIYIRKKYEWLDLKCKPDFTALSQKNAVIVHQITELIFNNTDVIILTFFTSLKIVSVYSMYLMIFGMVKSLAVTFSDSFTYLLGQAYADKKRFDRLYNIYEVYNMALTFSFFCIATVLMTPFLKLYTKGINDINYIDSYVLFLFLAVFLLQNGRKASQTVINIAQHFDKTKWRAVLEALINVVVSIMLTYRMGIYGVLIGTIVSLLYRTNDVIFYAAKLMKKTPLITYKRWMVNLSSFIFVIWSTSFINVEITSYVHLCVYGFIVSLVVVAVFIIVNSLFEITVAKYAIGIVKNLASSRNRRKYFFGKNI